MSFRNRCVVAGSNGMIHLSVPLEKGRSQKLAMKEVRISHSTNWQLQHWRSLESCYSRAPYFEYYRDWLEAFYKKEFSFLIDLNQEALTWLGSHLEFPAQMELTTAYVPEYEIGVQDLRRRFMPKNFQQQVPSWEYTQVFGDRIGFQPNLCILDLLFNVGPKQAKSLLEGSEVSF